MAVNATNATIVAKLAAAIEEDLYAFRVRFFTSMILYQLLLTVEATCASGAHVRSRICMTFLPPRPRQINSLVPCEADMFTHDAPSPTSATATHGAAYPSSFRSTPAWKTLRTRLSRGSLGGDVGGAAAVRRVLLHRFCRLLGDKLG